MNPTKELLWSLCVVIKFIEPSSNPSKNPYWECLVPLQELRTSAMKCQGCVLAHDVDPRRGAVVEGLQHVGCRMSAKLAHDT